METEITKTKVCNSKTHFALHFQDSERATTCVDPFKFNFTLTWTCVVNNFVWLHFPGNLLLISFPGKYEENISVYSILIKVNKNYNIIKQMFGFLYKINRYEVTRTSTRYYFYYSYQINLTKYYILLLRTRYLMDLDQPKVIVQVEFL